MLPGTGDDNVVIAVAASKCSSSHANGRFGSLARTAIILLDRSAMAAPRSFDTLDYARKL